MSPAHRRLRSAVLALLAASAAFSCATPQPATPPAPRPAIQMPVEPPEPVRPPAPEPAAPPATAVPPAPLKPGPAVTLLLPLDAPEFRAPAEAVRQGFMAALAIEGRQLEVVVRRTDSTDDRVLADYEAAIQSGTRLVVGPMTRSGVSALLRSGRLAVPTLALNQPESATALPSSLYIFGLAADVEARQIAHRAWQDTMRVAAVVSTANPLSRRTRDAFVDEWLLIGGTVTDAIEAPPGGDLARGKEGRDRPPPPL